jgi:hypothetical protein
VVAVGVFILVHLKRILTVVVVVLAVIAHLLLVNPLAGALALKASLFLF